jgi:hypothetical protein
MIHIGDKVKIGHTGAVYTTYPGFLDYYRDIGSSTIVERVCSQYEYGREPTETEAQCNLYTVMFVREHGSMPGSKLAVINDGNVTYIFDTNALTPVSSDMPFAEGDKVYISNSGCIYSIWSDFVKHMSTVIPDGEEVYRKWTYGRSPADNEVNGESPDAVFTVKWIGHHVSRPDEATIAIISNATSTYIIGTKGISKAGEKSWDKYIIYVRNWAVVNKDTAQSVRDAAGPKPYAEWLNNKS